MLCRLFVVLYHFSQTMSTQLKRSFQPRRRRDIYPAAAEIIAAVVMPMARRRGAVAAAAESIALQSENTGVLIGNRCSTAAVIVAAMIPCRAFPSIYGLRLRPEPEVTAITCRCTLIPEKPVIKEVSINFLYMSASSSEVLSVPVENSQRPDAAASSRGGRAAVSSKAREIVEKNIIEQHTVIIFFESFESDTEKTSERDISAVLSAIGGEL